MKSFPKKYNPQELRSWAKTYREQNIKEGDKSDPIFSYNILPASKKISYRDFFSIYLKDFLNYTQLNKHKLMNQVEERYEQLFVTYGNLTECLSYCYNFFRKRHQYFTQLGGDKIKRYITSFSKKHLNANNKILESYSSSNHKIYMPNSDLYIYLLEQFRSLWERGKIISKTKIGYRSFNLQTSIPEEKILRKEQRIPYYVLKYFIGAKGDALYVHIEGDIDICCGDVALLVHPKDKRYNKYIGKNAIIPLCNRLIPIIGDDTVNISQDNGIKRVCPCADEESIYLAKKHGLPTDIYVFNQQGLYTNYIREEAFVGGERNKYYSNILEFIEDIGNLAEKGEKTSKIPYLAKTNERLIPYKIDQLILDLAKEREQIINQIFENDIKYPYLDDTISKFTEEYDFVQNIPPKESNNEGIDNEEIDAVEAENDDIQDQKTNRIKETISTELSDYLPDSLICNSQILFGWKVPLIKDSEGNLSFFDVEKLCINQKQDPLQVCFNYVLLSLIRAGTIRTKDLGNENIKLCECDKLYKKFSENEKKIEYLVHYLGTITGNKPEYQEFLTIVENLVDEDSSTLKEFGKLIKKCKFLEMNGNWLITNIKGIVNDIIDPDFIELCIPCYLKSKGIKINDEVIFNKNEKGKIFKELLVQNLLSEESIYKTLLEYSYNENIEFLGDKELTKLQIEQSQWNIFSLYGENPIRLNLLINQTFDQKEILLNSIFLKQIWNATRFCIQKDFLPRDIQACLSNPPKDFEDFDAYVLEKLNGLHNEWLNAKTYEQSVKFYTYFKESIHHLFFSRYLEVIKIHPTKDVQFVCSYFFNFILTILYPFIPEFVDALQYISERNFICPISFIELDKATDYNMNVLYYTFIKIKQIKIECNIKQHESCNIFIKSTPTIGNAFAENEQIFKNYFHISEITYVRLHEPDPLGYEVFSNIFDDTITLGIQSCESERGNEKDTLENIEKNLKDLEDKLNLIRQRIQLLPEGEERKKAEEEYANTKEEMENLAIKHSILNSK